ncbi:hypothetical protein Ciccas_004552 [Cichlidogyrus casuarinus]|uniref:Ig-like domain-containing protein n=1 Tax=Cichlidogyrus casuarinus TaxID=1844966 RepID=A0ABD2QBN8_9PLAT
MTVQQGKRVLFDCGYRGFSQTPHVEWCYQPDLKSPRRAIDTTSQSKVGVSARADRDNATLEIFEAKNFDSGYYTMIALDPSTNQTVESSAKLDCLSPPQITKQLQNIAATENDPNGNLNFRMDYTGFKNIPQSVQWFHDDRLIDVGHQWKVQATPSYSSIQKNTIEKRDEGQYTCVVRDPLLTSPLQSKAHLKVERAANGMRDTIDATRKEGTLSRAVREEALVMGSQVGRTMTRESAPLTMRCPVPSESKLGSRNPRIQWLYNDTEIYDSGARNSMQANDRFTIGQTLWHAYVSDQQAILSTDSVSRLDAGKYTCRMSANNNVFESSASCKHIQRTVPAKLRVRSHLVSTQRVLIKHHRESPTNCLSNLSNMPNTHVRVAVDVKINGRNVVSHSRSYSDSDVVQASALEVLDIPEFVKPLTPATVASGDAVKLQCQLKPIRGLREPTVTWFHNGQRLDERAAYEKRLIVGQEPSDVHFVKIPRTQEMHEGTYRCEAGLSGGTAETSCQLIVEGELSSLVITVTVYFSEKAMSSNRCVRVLLTSLSP